jgi:hypothetical protein
LLVALECWLHPFLSLHCFSSVFFIELALQQGSHQEDVIEGNANSASKAEIKHTAKVSITWVLQFLLHEFREGYIAQKAITQTLGSMYAQKKCHNYVLCGLA